MPVRSPAPFRTLVFLILSAVLAMAPAVHAQKAPARPIEITDEEAQAKTNLVSGADGFDVHLFAAPPEVNYPAAITAAPNANLFVAVDKNASLDQERGRGEILKVTDTDDDGRADRYTVFVDSVDSPRGLVYDGERLYVMHPPTLTAYTDTDGDGVANRSRDLVTGLGFGLDFRGADHTTNGMTMGIDGWLYIAVGDYGFLDAEGTDGRRIQHRGGGIVRVRPDGSELEIYATGLRNVYDVTMDPFLNGFERGNTNDGHGWRVRLQHIVPQADYGYPSRFRYFADEVMPPLADYGGGSGAGALYVDAPHLPDSLGHTLYTVDWGRSAVFRHTLTPDGASFDPSQQVFLRVPQPTDMTIDGRSNLYVSSWMGASFWYAGEDVGFIARLSHEEASPPPAPDFESASVDRLLDLLASPHHLLRLHAQQELLRRDPGDDATEALANLARGDEPLDVRVAALFTLTQLVGSDSHTTLRALLDDPDLREFALRALTDRSSQLDDVSPKPFVDALTDDNPRVRLHALNGLARLNARDAAAPMMPLTADPDPAVAHVAVQSLVALEAVVPALEAVRNGSPALAAGAHRVLQNIHTEQAVDGLIDVWETSIHPHVRQQALTSLARLYHREGPWTRDDWWGTTPSTRGPYYAPVTWSESDRIRPVLRDALLGADGIRYRERVHRVETNRAVPNGSQALLLTAAGTSDSLKQTTVETLVGHASVAASSVAALDTLARVSPAFQRAVTDLLLAQRDLPTESAPLLRRAALDASTPASVRADALDRFASLASDEARSDVHAVLADLIRNAPMPAPIGDAIRDYASDDAHADTLRSVTDLIHTAGRAERKLGYAMLLHVAHSDDVDTAPQTAARDAIADAWSETESTLCLLWAIGFTETEGYAEDVQRHLTPDTDPDVREAAQYAAQQLGL